MYFTAVERLYRCESVIAIFAYRFTRNSANNPFSIDRNIDITMLIRMEPGETKNTNSESKPTEKDKGKKRNPKAY